MRVQSRYAFQGVVDEAVSQARQSFAAQGLAGFTEAPESTPPQITTIAATDDAGNTITLFPAMTEIDSTESSARTS